MNSAAQVAARANQAVARPPAAGLAAAKPPPLLLQPAEEEEELLLDFDEDEPAQQQPHNAAAVHEAAAAREAAAHRAAREAAAHRAAHRAAAAAAAAEEEEEAEEAAAAVSDRTEAGAGLVRRAEARRAGVAAGQLQASAAQQDAAALDAAQALEGTGSTLQRRGGFWGTTWLGPHSAFKPLRVALANGRHAAAAATVGPGCLPILTEQERAARRALLAQQRAEAELLAAVAVDIPSRESSTGDASWKDAKKQKVDGPDYLPGGEELDRELVEQLAEEPAPRDNKDLAAALEQETEREEEPDVAVPDTERTGWSRTNLDVDVAAEVLSPSVAVGRAVSTGGLQDMLAGQPRVKQQPPAGMHNNKKRPAEDPPDDQQQPRAKQQRNNGYEDKQQQQQPVGSSKHKPAPNLLPKSANHLYKSVQSRRNNAEAAAAPSATLSNNTTSLSDGSLANSERVIIPGPPTAAQRRAVEAAVASAGRISRRTTGGLLINIGKPLSSMQPAEQPFSAAVLLSKLQETGVVLGLRLSQLKYYAYVVFEEPSHAQATLQALKGAPWLEGSRTSLEAQHVPLAEAKAYVFTTTTPAATATGGAAQAVDRPAGSPAVFPGDAPAAAAAPLLVPRDLETAAAGGTEAASVGKKIGGGSTPTTAAAPDEACNRDASHSQHQPRAAGTAHAAAAAPGATGRRASVLAPAANEAEPEVGQLRLDELFRVTKAWPQLCYLPRTDEQVAKRRQERLTRQQQPALVP